MAGNLGSDHSSYAADRRPETSSALPFLFLIPFLFLLLLPGCGEEDGSPPVLTDVRYQSDAYLFGFPDGLGVATMTGVVDFEDPDGDLVVLSVTWEDCGLEPSKKLEIVQDVSDRTKIGTISFIIQISTNCPIGDYDVRLSATDGRGQVSNVLRASYEIYSASTGG